MERPWVTPQEVKDYSSSDKVKLREDAKIVFDIARAERYVIFYTNNKFDTETYQAEVPPDVIMAVTLLAEAYAKQAIIQKDGLMSSETFDDYSYTMDSNADLADHLGLGTLLEEYILKEKNSSVVMKLRKL